MLLQGLGRAIGVEGIVTKAIDVLGLVRTEFSQSFRVRGVTFLQQLPCTFSAITPPPPKHTHCTNLLNASLLLVAAWIVCRNSTLGFGEQRNSYGTRSIMQRIFSSATRRETLGKHLKGGRRGGELKIDWTKPPPRA